MSTRHNPALHTIPAYAFERLRQRGFASYADYLRSPEWAAVKWRYRHSRLPQTCKVCGDKNVDLHHRSYKRMGGDERLRDLIPLCREHHQAVHTEHRAKSGNNTPSGNLWNSTNATVKRERKRKQNRHRS